MKSCIKALSSVSMLVAVCGLAGVVHAQRTPGADVIVGDVVPPSNGSSSGNWGEISGVSAFSIGSTSCNKGDTPLNWYTTTNTSNPALYNQHPVIPQNLYRWKVVNGAGQFEQIGMSWLKHGYTALQQNLCQLGCTATGGSTLGVGCSDPYSPSLNGSQSRLGPRSQINAHTGYYPYPFSAAPSSTILDRRLRVANVEIDPAQNSGALYYGECQYVAPDDASYSGMANDNNNASYRRVSFVRNTGVSPNRWEMRAITGFGTVREQPGVYAWATAESGVAINVIDVPGEGRYILGSKATNVGGGVYHYEYALFNLSSDRAANSFKVNFPSGGDVSCIVPTNVGFKDVDYHSGEVYNNTDWASQVGASSVTWGSTETFSQNQNANALRWSTMYTFRFRSTQAPSNTGSITIGLFKPGTPTEVTLAGVVAPTPCPCVSTDYNQDGGGDTSDIIDLANDIASGVISFPGSEPDFNQDGGADTSDVIDMADAIASGSGC